MRRARQESAARVLIFKELQAFLPAGRGDRTADSEIQSLLQREVKEDDMRTHVRYVVAEDLRTEDRNEFHQSRRDP